MQRALARAALGVMVVMTGGAVEWIWRVTQPSPLQEAREGACLLVQVVGAN